MSIESARDDRASVTASNSAEAATTAVSPSTVTLLAMGVGAALAPQAHAATFNVTSSGDAGAGTLRQAIADANAAAGADTITFDAGVTSITLTTGELKINDALTITGRADATSLVVSGNNASRVFYLYSTGGEIDVTISGLTVTDGAAANGGGVFNKNENLTLDNVIVDGNAATADGGGVWSDGFQSTLVIRNSVLSGNTAAAFGGGLYVEDTGGAAGTTGVTLENTRFTGNTAARGGGVYLYDPDSDVVIDGCTISGNTATATGGGLQLYSFDGGASLTISNSTISANTATNDGGGMFFDHPDSPFTLRQVTIAANTAGGNGGGLFVDSLNGDVAIDHSTIDGNVATAGAGGNVMAAAGVGDFIVRNSIIADGSAPTNNDIAGNFDVAFSIIETPGSATVVAGAGVLNVDPQLGALANNGGATETLLPDAGSPAVNAGDPAFVPPPTLDQRGQPRVAEGRIDIGSVERALQPGTVQFASAASATVEGNVATFTVTRTGGSDGAVSVAIDTADGTAIAPGDYTAVAQTLTWADGDATDRTVNVTTIDDAIVEASETFTIALSEPTGNVAIGAAGTATGTINDNDIALPAGSFQFAVTNVAVDETAGTATITVQRVGGTAATTVDYATANGTATAPADYASTTGTLTWAANDTTPRTIVVPIVNDGVAEPAETFTVTLSNPTGGAVITGSPTATVTIAASTAGTPTVESVPANATWATTLLAALMALLGAVFVRHRKRGDTA